MVTPVTTLGFGVKCHFKQYFSYIVAVSFLGVASHWQTISHNVVSSKPRLSCKSNYHTITITTALEMNNIKIAYLISNGPTNCKMSDNNLNNKAIMYVHPKLLNNVLNSDGLCILLRCSTVSNGTRRSPNNDVFSSIDNVKSCFLFLEKNNISLSFGNSAIREYGVTSQLLAFVIYRKYLELKASKILWILHTLQYVLIVWFLSSEVHLWSVLTLNQISLLIFFKL